MKLCGARSGEG